MSTELAENRDLGPLGYPHHHGVLGFWRIFYTNLKIAIGLRALLTQIRGQEGKTNYMARPLASPLSAQTQKE